LNSISFYQYNQLKSNKYYASKRSKFFIAIASVLTIAISLYYVGVPIKDIMSLFIFINFLPPSFIRSISPLIKKPCYSHLTISEEGIHPKETTRHPIPWQAIALCQTEPSSNMIGFHIKSKSMQDVEEDLIDKVASKARYWGPYRIVFEPARYDREGPSLADQIRLHAPHLKPPAENI
jgi:hypothetical protein